MQTEVYRGNDAEGAEGPNHQFMQVISGNVFDYFPSGVGNGPVRQHNRHADNQVAQASVAQPEHA